jgi:hypothetical protein
VKVLFLAQPPLRANVVAVNHNQYANMHLGIVRGMPRMAIKRLELSTQLVQIERGIGHSKQVVVQDMFLQATIIAQGLLIL